MTADITTKRPVDILREIIVEELELSGDRVMIWNNKSEIPKDEYLFISLEQAASKAFSNIVIYESRDDGYYEVQTLATLENYNIDIMSRNLEALQRKEEVIMAMRSNFSQSKQVANGMMISKIANLTDISGVEASARLFRFQCVVTLQASYTKEKVIEYYTTFPTLVKTEDEEVEFTLPLT
ncbi:MAG: hypothetical protein JRJ39_00265 [Deltaproteobacteria bacterium]|nr:hypothetical protein [Deltaproteobacteria bacterium]